MLVYRFMQEEELSSMFNQFARKGFAVPSGAESHKTARNTFSLKQRGQKNFWFFCSLNDCIKASYHFDKYDATLVEFNLPEESLAFGKGYYGCNIFGGTPDASECICQKIPAYAFTGRFFEGVYDEEDPEISVCTGFIPCEYDG